MHSLVCSFLILASNLSGFPWSQPLLFNEEQGIYSPRVDYFPFSSTLAYAEFSQHLELVSCTDLLDWLISFHGLGIHTTFVLLSQCIPLEIYQDWCFFFFLIGVSSCCRLYRRDQPHKFRLWIFFIKHCFTLPPFTIRSALFIGAEIDPEQVLNN